MFSIVSCSLYSDQVLAFPIKSLHMTVTLCGKCLLNSIVCNHFETAKKWLRVCETYFLLLRWQNMFWTLCFFFFQVKDLTKFLDPSGLGVISFEDFHRGISAISNGGESSDVLQPNTKFWTLPFIYKGSLALKNRVSRCSGWNLFLCKWTTLQACHTSLLKSTVFTILQDISNMESSAVGITHVLLWQPCFYHRANSH